MFSAAAGLFPPVHEVVVNWAIRTTWFLSHGGTKELYVTFKVAISFPLVIAECPQLAPLYLYLRSV